MPESPGPPDIEPYIRTATRPESESDRLLRGLIDRSWPGGTRDRLEPLARGWLATWGPVRLLLELPVCSCRSGRCRICN